MFWKKEHREKPKEDHTVTEVCPECMSENTLEWDVSKEGYRAFCPRCGAEMMLCSECLQESDCDFDMEKQSCYRRAGQQEEKKPAGQEVQEAYRTIIKHCRERKNCFGCMFAIGDEYPTCILEGQGAPEYAWPDKLSFDRNGTKRV